MSAMRRALLWLVVVSCATPPPPPPPPKRDLRDELRRHGEWILVSPYGKLWHPNANETGKDFAPYASGGKWVRTDRGWTFEGPWEWSEVVFTHGRWLWTQDYDWLWSFDEEQGLNFVEWRTGSEFVGWSPIPPVAPRAGAAPPERRWFYVKARHFAQDEIAKYLLTGEEATRASELTEPLPVSPFSGPPLAFLVKNSGLVEEGDGGFRVPEIAAPPPQEPPAVQEAPKSNVEVEVNKPPEKPPKKTKGKKKKKK